MNTNMPIIKITEWSESDNIYHSLWSLNPLEHLFYDENRLQSEKFHFKHVVSMSKQLFQYNMAAVMLEGHF